MATADDVYRIARALADTTEAPHVDRVAFRRARIYATLAADRLSVNLKLAPDQQQLKCLTAPLVFQPVPGGWGAQGWTTVTLKTASTAELAAALRLAWENAAPNAARSRAKPAGGGKPKRR